MITNNPFINIFNIYIGLFLHIIPRYVQASEKQMKKTLPAVGFGGLATGADLIVCLQRAWKITASCLKWT